MTTVNNNQSVTTLCNNIAKSVENGATYSREELETLFEDTNYYNAGESGKAEIQKQIDALEKTIKALEQEAEDLQKEIDEKNLKVDDKAGQLSEIVGNINKGTADYQKDMKKWARLATREAIQSYKQGNAESFEQCFSDALNKKMGSSGVDMAKIQALYSEYDAIKGTLSPIMSEIEGYINEVKGIQTKLNSTNATINLLTTTKNNMTDTIQGAYKNVDTDAKVPVYSGAKADVANEILATYQSRYSTEGDNLNTATTEGSTEKKEEVQEKYLGLHQGDYTSGDKYNVATNPELANLRALNEAGMIEELQGSGMTVDEILTFVSSNWDVGISKVNGTWQIPKGHSSDAWVSEPVYAKLSELITTSQKTKTADSVNQTQLAELKTAVEKDGVLTKMYEAGFTFKEAMYVMLQAFPDAGLTYDLSSQSTRNYGKVEDNATSGTLFSTIGDQILEYWDVGATKATEGDDSTNGEVKGYDPITFQQGNTTFTFITDRNGDGSFDYTNGKENELLGSQNGIEELLAYDYNGDGIIDANDVDKDGNYALDQLTLMSNNQIESVGENGKEDVDGYKTGANYKNKGVFTNSVDFDVTYTNARQAGITQIDLRAIKASENTTGSGDSIGDSTKTYDNVQEKFEDINGSSVINQFNIVMNGETITANETLNTEDNLETFYGQVADKAGTIYSSISENEFNAAFDNWYNDDAESLAATLDGMLDNLENLKKEAQEKEGSGEYELNMSWEQFQELYGADGKSGTYVDLVKQTATAKSEKYANDEKKGINSGKQEQDSTSNGSLGADAVAKGLDELNESLQVEIKKDKEE